MHEKDVRKTEEVKKEKCSDCLNKSKKVVTICITIAIILIIVALITAIVVRNNNDKKENSDNNVTATKSESIIGNFKLIEMYTNGDDKSEDISKLDDLGLTVTLEINEDKTAKLNMFGDTEEFTYDDKELKTDESVVSYTYENNKITLEENEEKMVFERMSEDENIDTNVHTTENTVEESTENVE